MSTIKTTDAPPELRARVLAFAESSRLAVSLAVAELLRRGLDATEQRAAAGAKSGSRMSDDARAARSRLAAAARWLDGKTWPLETAGLPPGAVVRFARTPGGLIATFSANCPTCGVAHEHDERVTTIPAFLAADVPCCHGSAIAFRLNLEGVTQS